jgi:hypothetical protein
LRGAKRRSNPGLHARPGLLRFARNDKPASAPAKRGGGGLLARHPEVAAKRPSKGDGRGAGADILRGSLTLAPQDDGS